MLNAVFRLTRPRIFEVVFEDINLLSDMVLVRPTHLSICHADQRYYQGLRSAEILDKKLPMALIHEAVGEVVYDSKGGFKQGEAVVMIPNTPVETDDVVAENYLKSSRFRASGMDGFMQEYVSMGRDRLIKLPFDIDKTVAAFTELVTVSVQAINRLNKIANERRDVIGVWGDGNLGYITSLFYKYMFPETKLVIFGTDRAKLAGFTFADESYVVWDVPKTVKIDHAFECVGGDVSQKAINQIINLIEPEGTISILGVSEYEIPINTRMVLEKGLHIFGTSRSGKEDFIETVAMYERSPELLRYLSNIVGAEVKINSLQDISRAFELDLCKGMGKTIMIWNK